MKSFCDRYSTHAWVLFGASLLYNFLSGLEGSSLSVMYVELIADFNTTSATAGWLVSLRHGAFYFCSLLSTWLSGRMSLRSVALLGALAQAISVLIAAFSVNISMTLIFQGLLAGAGSIISIIPVDVAVPLVFHDDPAVTSGFSLLAVLLGMVFGPMFAEILLSRYGYHGATLLFGGILLNRVPLAMTIWCPEEAKPTTTTVTLRTSLFKEPTFLLFCLAASFQKFFSDPFVSLLTNYAVHRGATLAQATVLPTALYGTCAATGLVASIVSNFVSSKHRVLIFSLSGLVGTLASVLLIVLPSYAGDIVASAIGGIDMGLYVPLVIVILVDLIHKDRLMLAFPIFNTTVGFVTLFSTPFCGWLFDITGTYTVSYSIISCSAFISAILFFVTWSIHRHDASDQEIARLLSTDG
ncbi:hypothetical protein CAPTEDRAFT_212587 [Capitella teleta]|uniref:Major facilitator superfamily (MFS) profile domain-containing protein n=1 Tax=Capitella teleta TaxID=283909 RepID=R7TLT6_CAPTE|nr:hypothetical protein CAPTEDRAFT_212587 [Capitella teleta]|eukprot:ELT92516.1 hypothetical protein CAPTEDRAFT_212587 [Capitella teleta]